MIKDELNNDIEKVLGEIFISEIHAPEKLVSVSEKKLLKEIERRKQKKTQKSFMLIIIILLFNIIGFGAFTLFNLGAYDDLLWKSLLVYAGFSIIGLLEVLVLIVNDFRQDLKYILVK